MTSHKELKARAKEQIKGNIGMLFICNLIIVGISSLATPFLGLGVLIAPSFSLSTTMIYLALTQGISPQAGDIFKGFTLFRKALWLSIITRFFVTAWSLFFVMLGIIKGYAYSLAPYILADNPHLTAREALRKSKEMTDGHKGALFTLQLSFIGWMLLVPPHIRSALHLACSLHERDLCKCLSHHQRQ